MYNLLKINKKKKEKTLKPIDMVEEIHLPSIRFRKEELPEIKKWEVGKEYNLKIKAKMTSYSEDRYLRENKERVEARFDIIGVEPEGKEND